jgi:hypothetical protein
VFFLFAGLRFERKGFFRSRSALLPLVEGSVSLVPRSALRCIRCGKLRFFSRRDLLASCSAGFSHSSRGGAKGVCFRFSALKIWFLPVIFAALADQLLHVIFLPVAGPDIHSL